ncbi:hypothetical protein K458DRAFT_90460 [Lentithecium fluviatile CBS 122367]|uniref:Transcription factor domain-containing protein n=1 Tax=Lentithecium fluviatile CBS 122367 TaxID=1168545 RepID=A0A6G1IR45_9PLEO|nr:hypothetical protein K458DRAFT_90460 [Lentithecium fluviatile CBS 122367]
MPMVPDSSGSRSEITQIPYPLLEECDGVELIAWTVNDDRELPQQFYHESLRKNETIDPFQDIIDAVHMSDQSCFSRLDPKSLLDLELHRPDSLGEEHKDYLWYAQRGLELSVDGAPNFDPAVMSHSLEAYLETIHALYPFLDVDLLKRSFQDFSSQHSPDGPMNKIPYSLPNATVLLVLALGEVIRARTHSHSLRVRGFRTNDPECGHCPVNMEAFPGAKYFTHAKRILGNHSAGATVPHAQAAILAALYLNQFGRVLDSWHWISMACRIVLVNIRSEHENGPLYRSYYKDGQTVEDSQERYNLNSLICTYWTCRLLESDCLDVLSLLPPSGLMEIENVTYPLDKRSSTEPDKQSTFYSSLIFLRRFLGDARTQHYSVSRRKSLTRSLWRTASAHISLLEQWRFTLPESLRWKDSDMPSTSLDDACLRAEYYSGLCMEMCPYLRAAIDITNEHVQSGEVTDQIEVFKNASQCIESAVRSMCAFDRVCDIDANHFTHLGGRRLIGPNLVRTLHAQAKTTLLLIAVYSSNIMPRLQTPFLDKSDYLGRYVQRTMTVLKALSQYSPILEVDIEILREAHQASMTREHANVSRG